MSKSEKLFISRYNDFYGTLLTKHQCEMIKLYYDCDISLFEIAEQYNVSRQAVRDTIKRAEQLLVGYEQKLKLAENLLIEYELKLGLSKKFAEISDIVQKIENSIDCDDKNASKKLIMMLKDLLEDNDGDI